jgi:hypothetical protein
MDSTLFNFWLTNFLLPNLAEGDTLVVDNAAFHKAEEARKIISAAKCRLIFYHPILLT